MRPNHGAVDPIGVGIPLDYGGERFQRALEHAVMIQRQYRRNTLFHLLYSADKCHQPAPSTPCFRIGPVVARGSAATSSS